MKVSSVWPIEHIILLVFQFYVKYECVYYLFVCNFSMLLHQAASVNHIPQK